MKKTIKVQINQSLYDVALQHYGTLEGLTHLVNDNQIDWDANLSPGQLLIVRQPADSEAKIVAYLKARNIEPATATIQPATNTPGDFNNDFNNDFK